MCEGGLDFTPPTHTHKHKKNQEEYQNPVRLSYSEGASYIYLDLFTSMLLAKTRDSANYKEGLTNLLLGFFGGLLNYNAKQAGMQIRAERRQSFGFLRPRPIR